MVKAATPVGFEDIEESKPKCPDCKQPLTFVRTKSHEKRWYCYNCEKFTDHFAQPALESHARAKMIDGLNGLQVIDSHGMIVGRVRKITPADTGDLHSFVLSVDKEQLKNLLDERGIPREFEVPHDKVATIGDVVILSEVFSPSSLAPPTPARPLEEGKSRKCVRCGASLLPDAKYCIKCGTSAAHPNNCMYCGRTNPNDALYCMNCGSKLS